MKTPEPHLRDDWFFLTATPEQLESAGGDPFKEPPINHWNISENKNPNRIMLFCPSNWILIPIKK